MPPPTRQTLDAARARAESLRRQQIALQEELDWRCYRLYGLIGNSSDYECPDPPEIRLGERAFEIVLARRIAAGEEETTWFTRHGATPITEVPAHWPEAYRQVVAARIALIESDKYIGLIERPEYKRRWAEEPWAQQEQAALRGWLLDRLEDPRYWPAPETLTTTNKLADRARLDAEFMQMAEALHRPLGLRRGRAGRGTGGQRGGAAAATAALRRIGPPQAGGLGSAPGTSSAGRMPSTPPAPLPGRERGDEEPPTVEVTDRKKPLSPEGRGVGVRGDIPVPPKYQSKDFLKAEYWRLRGGLDVPKERFVSFPHCSRDADGSLVLAWAGCNSPRPSPATTST